MKNKLYLLIVICGVSFFFSTLLINIKIVNEVNKTKPNAAIKNNYISFFHKKEESDYLSYLSINASNIFRSIPNIKSISTYSSVDVGVGLVKDNAKVEKVALISSSFFNDLGIKAQFGSITQRTSNAILSYKFASSLSKEVSDLIGKQVWVQGELIIVEGILPESFLGIGENVALFLSEEIFHVKLQNGFTDQPSEWQEKLVQADTNQFVFGVIDSFSNIQKVEEFAKESLKSYNKELMFTNENGEDSYFNFSKESNIVVQKGVVLKPNEKRNIQRIVYPMNWITLLLAVATIINYFYYQLSILPLLQQSLSIKVVCGAPVNKVFSEYFIKAFLPLVLGLLISIPLEEVLFKILLQLNVFKNYFWNSGFEYTHILVGVFLSLLIALLSSFINTYYTYKKTNINMSNKISSSKIENIARGVSIVLLLSFGIIILFMVLLLSKDIKLFSEKDRGYQRDGLHIVYLGSQEGAASYSDLLDVLARKTNNQIAAFDVLEPIDNSNQVTLEVNGKYQSANLHLVTSDFFNITKLKLIAGGSFTKQSPSGVILSDSVIKGLGLTSENAIGKLVNLGLFGMQIPNIIIGVSKTLTDSDGDVYFNSFNPNSFATEINKFLIKSTLSENDLKLYIDDMLKELNWKMLNLESLQYKINQVNSNKSNLLLLAQIISIGILVLIISTAISHVRYDLNVRKKSRNIKLIFGATPFRLLFELLNQYLAIIIFSLLASLLITVSIKRFISKMIDQISFIEYFMMFLYSFSVLSLIIVITISLMSLNESNRNIEI